MDNILRINLIDRNSSEGDGDSDKASHVYAQLRGILIFGRVPPGAQLNIRKLANQLQVSPTPVREALLRLSHEEIVTMSPGRGFYAKPLSLRELKADYEMALMIATFCIERGVENFTFEGMQWPIGFGGDTDDALVAQDLTRSSALFLEALYERIAGLTANARLVRLMRLFNDRTTHVREIDLQQPERFRVIAAAMSELVDLLLKRDAIGAIRNLHAQYDHRIAALSGLVREGNARALEAAVESNAIVF